MLGTISEMIESSSTEMLENMSSNAVQLRNITEQLQGILETRESMSSRCARYRSITEIEKNVSTMTEQLRKITEQLQGITERLSKVEAAANCSTSGGSELTRNSGDSWPQEAPSPATAAPGLTISSSSSGSPNVSDTVADHTPAAGALASVEPVPAQTPAADLMPPSVVKVPAPMIAASNPMPAAAAAAGSSRPPSPQTSRPPSPQTSRPPTPQTAIMNPAKPPLLHGLMR